MLNRLIIKNVALIDSVEIDFTKGLNVLSGETGSGKSVIIESLNFVLGAKADKSLIRSGETECFVSAEFCVENNKDIINLLNEFDIEQEDVLIISRKYTLDGKNTIKLNGNTMTAGMLKKITSILVDVHGQSEHFELLSNSAQLDLIDKFGGNSLVEIKNNLKAVFSEYKSVNEQLNQLGGDENQRLIRLDILKYQINEIEQADVKDGEEEELITLRKKLLSQEKIINALKSIKDGILSEGGIDDVLSNSSRMIYQISTLGEEYSSLYNRIESVYSEINDISDTAQDLIEQLDFSEFNPDYIESRLDVIKSIKKKYGVDFNAVNEYLISAKNEIEKLENYNQLASDLLTKKVNLEDKIYNLYLDLSSLRKDTSEKFCKNVLAELKELGMLDSVFTISFNDTPSEEDCVFTSSNGIDKIEFLFSANSGEPPKSMSSIISGGEMSRFMLAVKTQTTQFSNVSTFLFDEIDAGISGNVAKVVSQKFARISKNTQIIAITHLPQISAMADNNLLIEKTKDNGRNYTKVKCLHDFDKVKEICRLTGGNINDDISIKHAENVIKWANEYKNSLN